MFRCPKRQNDAPFRVSIHDHADAFRLKIEGRIAAHNAAEIEARWRTGASTIGKRAFLVDLAGATSVDAAARGLLARMHAEGARLIGGGPMGIGGMGEADSSPEWESRGGPRLFRDLALLATCLAAHIRQWAGQAIYSR